jgi:hypothetical protein
LTTFFKKKHENNSNLIRFALVLLSIDTVSAQYEITVMVTVTVMDTEEITR